MARAYESGQVCIRALTKQIDIKLETNFLLFLNGSESTLPAGPVEVDLHMPAVNQLWSEFIRIVKTTNDVMLPFLKLFGVEEGNGVSPFARTFDTPSDLIAVINKFFQPPPSDPRDRQSDGNDDEQPESYDEDSADGSSDCLSTISANFLKERVEELIELDDAEEDETRSNNNENGFEDLIEAAEIVERSETFFNNGNVNEALPMLRQMLSQTSIVNVSKYAYNLTKVSSSCIKIVNKTIANFCLWLEL